MGQSNPQCIRMKQKSHWNNNHVHIWIWYLPFLDRKYYYCPNMSFYSVTQLLCSNISPIRVTMCLLFKTNMFNSLCGMIMLGREMSHLSQLITVRCPRFPRDPNVKTAWLHNALQTQIWVTYATSLSFSMLKVTQKDKIINATIQQEVWQKENVQ